MSAGRTDTENHTPLKFPKPRPNGVIAEMMKVSKPISLAFASATTWASAASSTESLPNRNSLALVFSPDCAMAWAMSSSSGKKRDVRSTRIGSWCR